jgi:hypothetical protein
MLPYHPVTGKSPAPQAPRRHPHQPGNLTHRETRKHELYRMREKFPTAAVAIFEFTGHWHQLSAGSARLTWFVTPRESMTLPVSAICTNHGERLVDLGVAMWNF